MNRTQKEQAIASLHQDFKAANLMVVVQQTGLSAAETTQLRVNVRKANAHIKVAKNKLVQIALKGTPFEGLSNFFKGPTVVALSSDPVAVAKVLVDYAKANDKLTIVGAGLNDQVLDKKSVEALSKLPSLNELRAKIVGMVQTPATRIAGVLQAPGGQVARVVSAYSKKGEAA